MQWIDNLKAAKKVKKDVIDSIDEAIAKGRLDGISAEEMSKLMDMRRKAKLDGVEAGDVLKVIANVTIVAVLVGFEMSHVMNQKGARFIKVL